MNKNISLILEFSLDIYIALSELLDIESATALLLCVNWKHLSIVY